MYLSRQLYEEALHVQFYRTLLESYVPDPEGRHRTFAAVENIPSIQKKAAFCMRWLDSIQRLERLSSVEPRLPGRPVPNLPWSETSPSAPPSCAVAQGCAAAFKHPNAPGTLAVALAERDSHPLDDLLHFWRFRPPSLQAGMAWSHSIFFFGMRSAR